jgi:hypothetical protein
MSPVGSFAPGAPTGPLRAADLAPARARRLTVTEIRNSVADIFFAGALDRVPPLEEATLEGFSNDIEAANVGLAFMESLETFATATSAKVVADLARLAPCNVAAMGGPACAAAFVAGYGPLIYRRPLDAMESARLRDTFTAASRSGTYEQSLEAVVQVMLMAPQFVYRTELGGGKDPSGIVTLTAHERAAALSYGFWQTTPDAQLTAAAASGALMSAAGLRAELKRLASSTRTRTTLRAFVREWLGIHPAAVAKADKTYTAAVARAAEDEVGRFVDRWAVLHPAHRAREHPGSRSHLQERAPAGRGADGSADRGLRLRPDARAKLSVQRRDELDPQLSAYQQRQRGMARGLARGWGIPGGTALGVRAGGRSR